MFFVADTAGYSLSSYYTSLGLFVISAAGLWSLIKRSVKSKILQKIFVGEGAEEKEPNPVAAEILSFFTRKDFVVTDREETIAFEGMMVPSRGQAALLTFCTYIRLASVALVLTITFPDVGNNWFWITVLTSKSIGRTLFLEEGIKEGADQSEDAGCRRRDHVRGYCSRR
ncbi:protein COFACTOR ASSEMBLY OF COMPLEX C SUBUNIT B CCB1, chloroplastic-like [Hibiscus syriacus]|uniref:protein COFACTOR ASSEMBLY OF COMPLEX C SUBUNIT B CCB1, chloroplastic-like n=1 Tax=Hibiscus syriacus TaxID=106335 RepID=UPI001920AFFA|nr:protein COFACTOR ASSEMBLY OF COMPLEX C SUBUNIT B CCB1, chloroplastic-like [Hibiscus syriacus]